MRAFLLLPLVALVACQSPDQAPGNSLENAVYGEPVVNDVAEAPAPARDNALAEAPLTPPAPGTPGGLPDDRTPVSEAPFTPDSAQGAANVVQTYFALIEAGKYRDAWKLWENGGRASKMSADAFAASFDKYAEYHAQIGAPGEIDAGAGQRYVTVPVVVYGRLKDGRRPFNMKGPVTLHRTEVDGATAGQRAWRIRSTDLDPRPGAAAQPGDEDNRSTARFRCVDGSRLVANFDPDNGKVAIRRGGKLIATLDQQRTASGIRYKANGYEFRGKGHAMTFTAPDMPPVACTAITP